MANAHITVLGRIVANPEHRNTNSGASMVKFRVAVSQGWGNRKTTGWYGVTVFGKGGKFVLDYCAKGDEVFVAGDLEVREVEGDGGKRLFLDITASSVEKTSGSKRKETVSDDDALALMDASADAPPSSAHGPGGAGMAEEDLPF